MGREEGLREEGQKGNPEGVKEEGQEKTHGIIYAYACMLLRGRVCRLLFCPVLVRAYAHGARIIWKGKKGKIT